MGKKNKKGGKNGAGAPPDDGKGDQPPPPRAPAQQQAQQRAPENVTALAPGGQSQGRGSIQGQQAAAPGRSDGGGHAGPTARPLQNKDAMPAATSGPAPSVGPSPGVTWQHPPPPQGRGRGAPQGAWGRGAPRGALGRGQLGRSAPAMAQVPRPGVVQWPSEQQQYRPHPSQEQQQQQQRNPVSATGSQPLSPDVQQQQQLSVRPSQSGVSADGASTSKDLVVVKRPPRQGGVRPGRLTRVESNNLPISLPANSKPWCFYDVTVEPDRPKRLLPLAVKAFVNAMCPGRDPAYDGKKILLSCGPLPFGDQASARVSVENAERRNTEEFEVTVRVARQKDGRPKHLDVAAAYRSLAAGQGSVPQECVQALDIVLRQRDLTQFIRVGRNFFSPPEGRVVTLTGGLEMWVGNFQSAISGWTKPFLNLDVAHKAFARAQSVLELITELNGRKRLDLKYGLDAYLKAKVEQYLKGLKVEYQIRGRPDTRRVYRVFGLTNQTANQQTFTMGEGPSASTVTVARYFMQEKACPLQFPQLPCLKVGNPQRNICLPPEFCSVLEGQPVMRKLDEQQTSAMVRAAATKPDVRREKVLQMLSSLGLNNNPCLRDEFGVSVSGQLQKVEARVLSPPDLEGGRNSFAQPRNGVWQMRTFQCGASLQRWAVLSLVDPNVCDPRAIGFMVTQLTKFGKEAGMTMSQCGATLTAEPYKRDVERELDNLRDCELVVCVVPDRGTEAYAMVKQTAELQLGLLTQCVKSSTVMGRGNGMSDATARNLLLKINAKMNGVNHSLAKNSRPTLFDKPVMIMGADVTHPPPDSKNGLSFAAVTASHNPQALFNYNMEWRLQLPPRVCGSEVIQDLKQITVNQLKFFYNQTKGQKPQRILYYRDGVGEGDFQKVMCSEVSAIKQACRQMQSDYEPQVTFLVVQKRHHTRFFPQQGKEGDKDRDQRTGNVPPGLVVDSEITQPEAFDFFLVSHASIQGTARPTKYQVLYDDANMTEDEVEQLTYYLCHLFSRCNRTVSYPAPTYYAHLAAFRAKAYLEGTQLQLKMQDSKQQETNLQDLNRQLAQLQSKFVLNTDFAKGCPMFFV